MKQVPKLLLMLSMASLSACASEAENKRPSHAFDVPPVTEGDWYRPTPDTRWQWQLSGDVNTGYNVEVYDIDLFDNRQEVIAELKNSRKKVICYFSAGSSEDWRPDFNGFSESGMGKPMEGWEGERWLDVRSENVR